MISEANLSFQLIGFGFPYTVFDDISGAGSAPEIEFAELLVQQAVYQLFRENAALSAMIGTRLFPVKLPQKVTFPAVTYEVQDARHIEHLSAGEVEDDVRGSSGLVQVRFRFKSFAYGISNYGTAVRLDALIRLALQGLRKVIIGDIVEPQSRIEIQGISARTSFSGWDDRTQTHWIASEFEIWAEEQQPILED